MDAVTLTELNVYPLKSGGGTALRSAELTARGLRHDREFMLIRPDGRHLSQREHPRMALLRPAFDGAKLTVDVADPALAVTPFVHSPPDDGAARPVTVLGKECLGVDQGDDAADWFSALLDAEVRLVRFSGHRATAVGGGQAAYADGYPLLVISQESLDDLNGRLDTPLPMNRFRPSLVIRGLGAYGEDAVRLLRIGGAEIELVKACGRCVITTTDQDSGLRGREPLRTLATYRTRDGRVRFGQNAVPRVLGELRVGDRGEVLRRHARL